MDAGSKCTVDVNREEELFHVLPAIKERLYHIIPSTVDRRGSALSLLPCLTNLISFYDRREAGDLFSIITTEVMKYIYSLV